MSTSFFIAQFNSEFSSDPTIVGGKGANLGRLTHAGFPVPSGFSISTHAYCEFISATSLAPKIDFLLGQIDYADANSVEKQAAAIREAIIGTRMPGPIEQAIKTAYERMPGIPYVAVRSSGTAEDLSGASFAGLHDTYLDVRGAESVVGHVQRCWASMWTARALSYRHDKGFSNAGTSIAVVVQEMVSSDVSGVMFIGNPVTGSTEEIVINASWGLGEAVVSGLVTPDQWIVQLDSLRVLESTIGTKEKQIVRNKTTGAGTVTEDVAPNERGRLCLTEEQLAELAALGRRICEHYESIPQDIEWAIRGHSFYILQSRPATGVEFSWDDAVDAWRAEPADPDTIWTRSLADEVWTGAIAPLFYSIRAHCWQMGHEALCRAIGLEETAKLPLFKFHKAEAYLNCSAWRDLALAAPLASRSSMLAHLPPTWRDDVTKAPFDKASYWLHLAKIQVGRSKEGVYKWFDNMDHWIHGRFKEASGLPVEELRRLSDRDLKRYMSRMIDMEAQYHIEFWIPFWIYARDAVVQLQQLVARWYDGDNPMIVMDLVTGVPKRTITGDENHILWELTEKIRSSKTLKALFEKHPGRTFFDVLDDSVDGRAFKKDYQAFLDKSGHRGHTDRDMYYPRRVEDPAVDYQIFKTLLTTDGEDPAVREKVVNKRREAATEEVLASIRKKPFGALKAEGFKALLDYVLRFLMARDNERYIVDRTTFTIKVASQEMGRRLVERGLLQEELEIHFLSKDELYSLLDGNTSNMTLVKAKIAARKHDFDLFLRRERTLPSYLKRGHVVNLEGNDSGALQGIGTSRGRITGVARVVNGLHEIGRVQSGDILICNSTDPAWTPVFMAIRGLVLETGGMLAHGSLLSREYGIPAVQLAGAVSRIPDGATITVDGDAGLVAIEEADAEAVAEAA